jgi:hypothetical protein
MFVTTLTNCIAYGLAVDIDEHALRTRWQVSLEDALIAFHLLSLLTTTMRSEGRNTF